MSDIESLQYLSGQLRRGAQQFSNAAQTLQQQGQRLDWSAQDLATGVNAWAGQGSQNFTTSWNRYHQSTQRAATAMDNTSQALTRLAQKIDETVAQLQEQQAQQSAMAIGMGVLTVGLVVLDVLQLGLDPVTDGLTVAAGSADAAAITGTEAAAGSAEVAAQGLVEADAQIAGDLDEIASGIDNVADSGDMGADGGGAPGDVNFDDGPFGDGNGEPSDQAIQYSRLDSPDDSSGTGSPDGFDDPRLQDLQTRLSGIRGTSLDEWSQLSPEERLNTLQEIDNQIADAYGFPANQITSVDMAPHELGQFIPETGDIEINSSDLGDDGDISKNYQDALETLAHESRHAYQQHLVDVFEQDPASLSDADKALAQQWSENMKPGNYIDPEDDFDGYLNQPIEVDAENWATEIFPELLGDL